MKDFGTTGIGDVFEKRHARTGVSVASLVSVFADIAAISGYVRHNNGPSADFDRVLRNYPLKDGDYPTRGRRQAQSSLERAHKQHAKGWLTDDELAHIVRLCVAEGATP